MGKTFFNLHKHSINRKHPHGRGEDYVAKPYAGRLSETPPRAWGRHIRWKNAAGTLGNTPTGVGKTAIIDERDAGRRKHPHGRGEDASASAVIPPE